MDAQDDLIGKLIDDRYRLLRQLGVGGMGVVYEVEHVLIGRRLALKRLDPSLAHNRNVLLRFQREAKAAAAIGDEHIVEVSDMGRLRDGSPYIVMELLEGSDLGRELKKSGPLSISRAVHIAKECCNALGAAHDKGIIHRDVKPDNIFLTKVRDEPDFVKILDFGISKFKEAAIEFGNFSMTKTGVAIGTPYYMSPEQVMGDRSLDARTDIYAMGVVLFQMLSGRVPFEASTYPALIIKIVNEPVPSLLSLRTDIPSALEQVVHKAMAKEPSERFGSMQELSESLSSFKTLIGKPQLTHAGETFTRTSTPQFWERLATKEIISGLSRGQRAKTFALLGGVTGALVFAFYLIIVPLMTSKGPEDPSTPSTNLSVKVAPEHPDIQKPGTKRASTKRAKLSSSVAMSDPTVSSDTQAEPGTSEVEQAKSPVAEFKPFGSAIEKKGDQTVKKPAERSAKKKVRKANKKSIKHAIKKSSKSNAKEIASDVVKSTTKRTSEPTKEVVRSQIPFVSVSAKKPAPANRRVRLKSQHRSSVSVKFDCGGETKTTSIPANGRVRVTIPMTDCRVTCTGLGNPRCPLTLYTSARDMQIH